MSVSSMILYTIECDDGSFCDPHRRKVEIPAYTTMEACNKAKKLGWKIRHYHVATCPNCLNKEGEQ